MSIEIVRPSIFSSLGFVVAGMSTALGGVSRPPLGLNLSYRVGDEPSAVEINRGLFFDTLGVHPRELAFPHQVHSATIRHAADAGEYHACDALVTSARNVALVVTVADCVPILLVDPVHGIAAAVHAGWRGSAERIAEETIRELRSKQGVHPADIRAWIGPSAGPCCYAVGEDVARRFPSTAAAEREGRWYVDLKAENERQLTEAGVPQEQIERSQACTICDRRFHSHRRDGAQSGRMMAVLMLRDQ